MQRSADALPSPVHTILGGCAPDGSLVTTEIAAAIEKLGSHATPRAALLDTAIAAVGAERGFVLDRNGEEWVVRAARTFEGEDVLHPLEKVILPVVERAEQRREAFATTNLTAEEIWPSLERQRTTRTCSLQVHPLPDGAGYLYLDHRFRALEAPSEPAILAAVIGLLSWLSVREDHKVTVERLQDELRRARADSRGRLEPATRSAASGEDADSVEAPIIGEHSEILEVQALINRVAPSDAPVLVTGESGTGKELVARSIHARSLRCSNAFISENCGAITETLLESELFGCVKGAYTGADEDRPGLFELASGGTIFLDEIGDTSPGLQKKLLRVLQEGMVRRVGGANLIPVDVRVLSATNRDLYQEVQSGNFREDLFYRLNVINIQLPPLRDRREDIPMLAEHFLAIQNERSGQPKETSPEWIEALLTHHWPGNIRELQNEVRRSHALSGNVLDPAHLSSRVGGGAPEVVAPFSLDTVLEAGSLKAATEDFEKSIIESALKRYRGNRAKVCETLGIPKTTLYAKIRRYALE